LLLPTTFDKDPQLRVASGIVTIILVALLTGGYSLTALVWFACPAVMFRQDCIYIPAAASSAFGFLACVSCLAISSRFDASLPSCAITIVLSLLSTTIYGGLALHTRSLMRRFSRQQAWPAQVPLYSPASPGYYTPYAPSTHHLTAVSVPSERASVNYNSGASMTEDEMVSHQMAQLLANKDPQPSPDPAQSTFRLEWPPGVGGEDDEEEDGHPVGRTRSRTVSGSGRYLAPGDPARHGRSRSDVLGSRSDGLGSRGDGLGRALTRIGRAMGMDRGRQEIREGQSQERAKSREERRREIELGHL
jgi:hypothetical protein